MALSHYNIPITREMVHEWLQEYDGNRSEAEPLREFIRSKVDALDLPDTLVDTSQRDDYATDEVDVVDLIMGDINSYG